MLISSFSYNKIMKKYLIQIAKDAIKEELTGKNIIDREALLEAHPELAKKGASFITLDNLDKQKQLRGCIGSLVAHRSLLDDIVSNAKAAAFRDSRFNPVSVEEFDTLGVEVSLLTEPHKLRYHDSGDLRSKIRVGVDGIVLKLDGKQATFLPQVWEQLEDFDQFFFYLCQKAGLAGTCLELHPDIFTYQVEKIKE